MSRPRPNIERNYGINQRIDQLLHEDEYKIKDWVNFFKTDSNSPYIKYGYDYLKYDAINDYIVGKRDDPVRTLLFLQGLIEFYRVKVGQRINGHWLLTGEGKKTLEKNKKGDKEAEVMKNLARVIEEARKIGFIDLSEDSPKKGDKK
jgi:hypothetical protein